MVNQQGDYIQAFHLSIEPFINQNQSEEKKRFLQDALKNVS